MQVLAQRAMRALELEGHSALLADLAELLTELHAFASPAASCLLTAAAAQRAQRGGSHAGSAENDSDEEQAGGVDAHVKVCYKSAAESHCFQAQNKYTQKCIEMNHMHWCSNPGVGDADRK